MKNKALFIILLIPMLSSTLLRADEGMWIPMLIDKYNIRLMQENGFKLTAEDIYSINRASMKDAVVIFGGGCTGEFISDKGLIITNHHCGYSYIQKHSTIENDYLTEGFWARSQEEELSNPGLTVTIMKYMEEVTEQVLEGVTDDMTDEERETLIDENILSICSRAVDGTDYSAYIKPFYLGNQYFLIVNEIYNDVRLVGAPPSAIGKFGGDTDNWVWPRHTGDFSLFRVYADKENKPAGYSAENIPYKPAYFFPVSLKGVNEGDFTMVFGYPGKTQEYAPSNHISMLKDYIYPKLVEIRGAKIEIIDQAMNSDPEIRIQYAAKESSISNAWKKWIGEIQSLERTNGVEVKESFEKGFAGWVASDDQRKIKYGSILDDYREIYDKYKEYYLVNSYTSEVFFSYGIEAASFAARLSSAVEMAENNDPELQNELVKLQEQVSDFFKNYNAETDKKLFVAMMTLYGRNVDEKWQTQVYKDLYAKCNGNFGAVAGKLYSVSFFTDENRLMKLLNNFDARKVQKDPLYLLSTSAYALVNERVKPEKTAMEERLAVINKLYMTAQMEYEENKTFYPDANFTLRVAYGRVMGYDARDGVYHKYFTTLTGIMEKDNPEIYDYDVPDRLKELYKEKDFGRYGVNGDVPVCFIANNHTTGGNSGSPVINAEGHLIGVNFDRAWEGVASDILFNNKQSRNISLDIRYALFIIDKFAGAGYLVDEMKIAE